MNEEIQNPQTNNQQSEENKSQAFPAWAVVVSILLIILIVIGIYFVFVKPKNVIAPIQPGAQEQTKNVQPETQVPAAGEVNTQTETGIMGEDAATSNVDVDYELKKMDESIGSVNDNDFNSGGLSNAEIGL